MPSVVDRLAYTATQAARIAWFAGHYVAARRIGKSFSRETRKFEPEAHWPSSDDIRQAMFDLFETDWRDISRGVYRAPREYLSSQWLSLSRKFLADVAEVDRRRAEGANSEVFTEERKGRYPRYYLQNFHFQTDGWFSEHSAKLYDFQV